MEFADSTKTRTDVINDDNQVTFNTKNRIITNSILYYFNGSKLRMSQIAGLNLIIYSNIEYLVIIYSIKFVFY